MAALVGRRRRSSERTGRNVRRQRNGVIVVAGLIERDGHFLVGQRKAGRRHGMKWEFPGGKVEPGESPQAALERELAEELAIAAKVGPEIVRYEHSYPGRRPILLIFYKVQSFSGEPVNRVFEEIRWQRREKLLELDFLDGDYDFIRRLLRGEFRGQM